MFGVQMGIIAACFVLFVPMAMAGWHLSRNKILFFSCALFISLAVCVHLTPFFPSSIPNLFSSSIVSPPIILSKNRDSCISSLHRIVFHVNVPPLPLLRASLNNSSDYNHGVVSWDWIANSTPDDDIACDFRKLGVSDASDLLNGSWIVVAGDSQARFFALSLLNLLLNSEDMESAKFDLSKRHTNYEIAISEIGIKFDFIWAPFVSNLTRLTGEFKRNGSYPDVLVMGSGLWHMLHIANESDYGVSLRELKKSMVSLLSDSGSFVRSPHLFWLGMPMLINSMLNTVEKRERMSNAALHAYNREVLGNNLFRQAGGPLLLLNMDSLSRNCGNKCTMDGMHYDVAIYEAAVHIMLNALLIESHQNL